MDCFYNKTVYKITKNKTKASTGDWVEVYAKSTSFNCDVQPSDATLVKKTFGDDIVCNYVVYANEIMQDGGYLLYNNKPYKVLKSVYWDDYACYAVQSSDIKVTL